MVKKVRERVQLFCHGEPRTKQSFKEECDINNIVARFARNTGVDLSKATGYPLDGMFGDFSNVGSLRDMYERFADAEESFLSLPAKIRKRFSNDPLTFMEFCSDEKNIEEMRALGLVQPSQSPESGPSVETPKEQAA